MNHEALGDRVRRGDAVFGAWSVLAGAVSARALAVAGLDYVVIDLQHGVATEHDLPAMTSAISLAGAAPSSRPSCRPAAHQAVPPGPRSAARTG